MKDGKVYVSAQVLALLLMAFASACEEGPAVENPSGPGPGPSPTATIAPSNRAPTVFLGAGEPRQGVIRRVTRVAFVATAVDADGDGLSFAWDFGDGTTEAGGSGVAHSFERTGSVEVIVTVDDGRGGRASAKTRLDVDTVSGRWFGLTTNGPNGGLRVGGDVTQTGRRFDGDWSSFNGDGSGNSRGVAVGGALSDPRDMTFTVYGLCGGSDATFRGSFSDDLQSFNGEGSGCENLTFRRIELFR